MVDNFVQGVGNGTYKEAFFSKYVKDEDPDATLEMVDVDIYPNQRIDDVKTFLDAGNATHEFCILTFSVP